MSDPSLSDIDFKNKKRESSDSAHQIESEIASEILPQDLELSRVEPYL